MVGKGCGVGWWGVEVRFGVGEGQRFVVTLILSMPKQKPSTQTDAQWHEQKSVRMRQFAVITLLGLMRKSNALSNQKAFIA